MAENEKHSSRKIPWHIIIPAILLAIGLGMRIFGAWAYEFAHTSDHGIICLMVKHMVEGKELPVFFYGLPYMGSIEPILSAILCQIFGMTGFWINMGTALIGFAVLPVVYVWGKAAGGRTAGIAALAFCAVGPPHYFQFQAWADGGYAAILFLSASVLFLTARMMSRELEGGRNSHLHFLTIGIVAGLGWWQSPLLVASFMTAAILFLAVMRLKLFTIRIFSGLGGFLTGSLPLWIWNIRNNWQTFDMLSMKDRPPFWESLRAFFFERIPDLLALNRQTPFIKIALSILLAALAVLAIVVLVRQIKDGKKKQAMHIGTAVLFIVVYSILFGRSRFARLEQALRYVLMLMPLLAVLIGVATAWLARVVPFQLACSTQFFRTLLKASPEQARSWAEGASKPEGRSLLILRAMVGLGWIPLVSLVAVQLIYLPNYVEQREKNMEFLPQAEELAQYLRENSVAWVYTQYQRPNVNHGLNYLLNEEFLFSPYRRERYRPYAIEIETTDKVAVIDNLSDFKTFLKTTRGKASRGKPAGILVHHHVEPPTDNWVIADDQGLESVIDTHSNNITATVLDSDMKTMWNDAGMEGKKSVITLTFKTPIPAAGLRLLGEASHYPGTWSVDAWDNDSEAWVPALKQVDTTAYFWSGRRFYWGGHDFRLECRFKPVSTTKLRLKTTRAKQTRETRIMELQVFVGTPPPANPIPEKPPLLDLAAFIRDNGITKVYADRWEANALYKILEEEVRASRLRATFGNEVLPPEMTIDSKTAIVVSGREADFTRMALDEAGIELQETEIGPWLVIQNPAKTIPLKGYLWVGFGCAQSSD